MKEDRGNNKLHEIIFYEDSSGKNPVREYMRELEKSKSKDSRIKLNKINDYIQALSVYGSGGVKRELCEAFGRRDMGAASNP